SGILFNLFAAVTSVTIWIFTHDIYTLFFCVCNIFLAVINLIPVPTFDGARAIETVLCEYCGEEKTRRYMDNVYYFSFLALVILSLCVLDVTDGNFSLVILLAYMFICIYAGKNTDTECAL
ncbi:MAG: M50 family metallopeptidase, partial [Clostridia bacterium]|nr:M50 family metallopeptidase [Clostridia bacterium]